VIRLLTLALAPMLTHCAKDSARTDRSIDPETADTYDGPPLDFEEALTEVLVPNCGSDACHGSGAGYLRVHDAQTEDEWLEKQSIIVAGEYLIRPGDSSHSYLIKKMEGASNIQGSPMPPSETLSGYRVGQVRSWIDSLD
jgi:hypothetical protein